MIWFWDYFISPLGALRAIQVSALLLSFSAIRFCCCLSSCGAECIFSLLSAAAAAVFPLSGGLVAAGVVCSAAELTRFFCCFVSDLLLVSYWSGGAVVFGCFFGLECPGASVEGSS